MQKFFLFFWPVLFGVTLAYSQTAPRESLGSCTSIMVGKQASADGSVITSHTCDGRYRTWMEIVPGQKHKKGETAKILRGTLFTERMDEITTVWQTSKVPQNPILHDFEVALGVCGEIPEAEETYAFLYTAYPCMNEKNLAIGETTIEGRPELVNDKGMFYIEELERIALQRCTTAREAIVLMGELVKKYGYADIGECLTVADKNEVWHFEIFGEGPDKIGGVWAAQRIPDHHVGISANISRIGELHLEDKDRFMASENVFEVAERMGFWDGQSTFKMWKAYSGRKPFSIREWFVLSSLAPSLHLSLNDDELPFSVQPEQLVSVRDVLRFFRTTYEDTPYDMTKNLLVERKRANSEEKETLKSPYASPWPTSQLIATYNALKDSTIVRVRNIAVPQCSYAHVIQVRNSVPDEWACVAYLTNDNPGQSPRIPVYASILQTPESYKVSGHKRYVSESAAWTYRRTNKLASVRWQELRKKTEPEREFFENKLFDEQGAVEAEALKILNRQGKQACRQYLTQYLSNFAAETEKRWRLLEEELWYAFIQGL
ncbi:MAG: C69 family dipeptidase [Dysgonamonadaceae bacterium]|jgi:dipeptidase|nr:C69 family dipeptidase [Dysgonamonadaceae bacterium]